MHAITEYMPAPTKAETEKMVDELRALGMQEIKMQMLAQKPQNKKK